MSRFKIAALLSASLLGLGLGGGQAQAAPVTDTVEAPTGFFVPTDAQKLDAPFYRGAGEGLGWTHGMIGGAIASASLNISAFDVDAPDEVDNIYAMDSGVWTLLGSLTGSTNAWDFTSFMLGANFYDDINAGLQVKMEIDTTGGRWFVALGKSSLSVDGGSLPPPVPGIPEPETYAMLLAGLAAMGAVARRRQRD